MKKRIKLLLAGALFAFCLGAFLMINISSTKANSTQDICSHFVPALHDCTWHPVNCFCPIVVEPIEN